jgi:hypothetical protein
MSFLSSPSRTRGHPLPPLRPEVFSSAARAGGKPCSLLHIGPYGVSAVRQPRWRARLLALVSADTGEGDSEADLGLPALIKASASTASLASMLTEI